MSNSKNEIKAYIGMTLATLIIGLSLFFVKIALRSASTTDIMAHRFTAAAAGMLVVYLFRKSKFPKLRWKELLPLLGLSVFYPILLFSLQTEGLKYTTVSEAGIILATMPVFTVAMAAVFLKERSNIMQLVSIALSVMGIAYILYQNGLTQADGSFKGNMLVLASVLSMVTYYVLGRRINKGYNPIDITFVMIITSCVVFNSIAIFNHIGSGTLVSFVEPLTNPSFLLSVLYLGVLSSFVTSLLSNHALTVIPASQVAVFNNLSPIISIIAGVVLLGERLYLHHIVGGVIVLIGVVGTITFKERGR